MPYIWLIFKYGLIWNQWYDSCVWIFLLSPILVNIERWVLFGTMSLATKTNKWIGAKSGANITLYLGELAGQHFSLVIVGALLVTMSVSHWDRSLIWNLYSLAPTLLIIGVSGVQHVCPCPIHMVIFNYSFFQIICVVSTVNVSS